MREHEGGVREFPSRRGGLDLSGDSRRNTHHAPHGSAPYRFGWENGNGAASGRRRRTPRDESCCQASFIPSLFIIALSFAFCSSERVLRNFGKTSSSSIRICSWIIDRKSRTRASHSALSFGIVSSS